METLARLTGFGASAPAPAPERVTFDDSDDADMSEGSDNEGEDVVQVVDDAAAEAGFARASDDDEDEDGSDTDSFNDASEGASNTSSSTSSSAAASALEAAVQERQAEMERAAAAAASGALEASKEAAAAALAEVEKGTAEIAAAAAAVASAPPMPAAAAFERSNANANGPEAAERAPAPAAAAAPPSSSSSASAASSLVASLMRRVTGAESAPEAAAADASTPAAAAATPAAAPSLSSDAAAAAQAAAAQAAAASAPATSAWASGSLPWLPRRAAPAPTAPAAAEGGASSEAAPAPAPPAAAPAPAGGLTGLPPRPAPASSSTSTSSSSSQQHSEQQAAPSRPAGGLGSLPPRPAGGVGALPPRGGGGGSGSGSGSGGGGAPSAGAAASTPSTSGGAGGGAGGGSSSQAAPNASNASGAPAANGGAATAAAGGGGAGGGGDQQPPAAPESSTADEPAEAAALRARIRDMVVILFRLCLRLKQPPAAPIARNTMSKLMMAERIRLGNAPANKGLDPQKAAEEAEQLEKRGDGAGAKEDLPLDCTVLVLGPAGAGKTSMIKALLRESGPAVEKGDGTAGAAGAAGTAASTPSPTPPTKSVVVTSGKVAGCTLNFIDTPGLLRGPEGIRHNLKVLKGVRAAQAKHRPTMVLYVDRMDTPPRGGGSADAAMLKSVSDALGRAVWFNTILVLTHAASAPPDGASGTPLPHDAFSQNRMHLLQQGVRAAAGDGRLFNPAALVDCHPRCRVDPETGDALLPSGAAWRPSLVMWCLASKLLADAEDVLHVGADKKKKSGGSGGGAAESMQERIAAMMRGSRLPPIPHLLSKLNKGKNPVAQPDEDADVLPLGDIKKLRSDEQRNEELKRRKELVAKRREERQREGAGSSCPLYSPEPPLAASFDEVPEHAYRYRDYDDQGSWITRPFIEPTPLDHDDGIDGVQAERTLMLRRRNKLIDGVPCRVFGQFQKDKEKTTVHAEAEATLTHRLAEGIMMDEAVAAAAKERKRQKKLKKAKNNKNKKRKGGGKAGDDDDDDDDIPPPPPPTSRNGKGGGAHQPPPPPPRAPLLGTVTTTLGVEGMTFQRDMLYTARAETRTNVPGLPLAKAAVGVSASRLVEGGGAPTGQGPIAYGAKVDTRMGVLQGAVEAGMTLGAMTTSTARGGRETATAGSTELNFAPEFGGQYTVGGSFMNFRKDLGLQGNLGTQWGPTQRTTVAANATLNNKGAGGLTLRVTSTDKPKLGLAFLVPVLGTLWNAVASRRGGGEEEEGEEEIY